MSIKCHQIEWSHSSELEYVGLKVLFVFRNVFLYCLFIKTTINSFYEDFYKPLQECHQNKELLVLDKFYINWDNKSDRIKLKEVVSKLDFTKLVKAPTRVTSSSQTQIDSMFTNRPEWITNSLTNLKVISDHNTLFVRKLTRKAKAKI